MKSYLSLVSRYFAAHRGKSRLLLTSVAIAVALVTGIFSMLDSFMHFEKVQTLYEFGNYHLAVENATAAEMQAIAVRADVQNAGRWISFRNGTLNGRACWLGAMDEGFAPNMNIALLAGAYPRAENEMMLEGWAAEALQLSVGDTAGITFADGSEKTLAISGVYRDLGNTQAAGMPAVLLSVAAAEATRTEKESNFLIEFKKGVNIRSAERAIKSSLGLPDGRVGRNERLLAVLGQSTNNAVIGIYATGAILFSLVLIAGVTMIHNTFNISVMERVRQFGLLRCIGASRSQIRKLVQREGLHISLRAIPVGVLAGMVITLLCTALLRFNNANLFGGISLFRFSIGGVAAGVAVGLLTVSIATFLPAKRAADVSPINAVTGSSEVKISTKKTRGLLTRLFHVETAMGIRNAVAKKRTLFLMSCSIAISIVMFLGFQVLVGFLHTSIKTTKPYTPDITLVSEQGMDGTLYKALQGVAGAKAVYGRMFSYVDATFNAERLTEDYKASMGGIPTLDNGLFDAPERSWLISYEENQLRWARADLIEGEISEQKLNEGNGVIAVAIHTRNNTTAETTTLRVGDKVYIQAPGGTREMTVMGVLRSVPFNGAELALTTFVTTEKLFTELTGEASFRAIDIQLARAGQERAVNEIRGMLDGSVTVHDARQRNAENDQAFFTAAVFTYGFVAVIALMSVLNIINTMNTSVASRTRYLGVMRAVGMSGAQLDRMVLTEAITYSLTGCIAGCILGVVLQKVLVASLLSQYHIVWRFPAAQIGLILATITLVTVVSIIGPLRRIKAQGISEVIGSL